MIIIRRDADINCFIYLLYLQSISKELETDDIADKTMARILVLLLLAVLEAKSYWQI